MPKVRRKIYDMEMTPTDACRHLQLSYRTLYHERIKPPTCTCFGHSYGHPQGGNVQRIYYRNITNKCTNINYSALKCVA